MDLTKNCALCGAMLPCADRLKLNRGERFLLGQRLGTAEELLSDAICDCQGRGRPGKCGTCLACSIELIGCACDGAYDNGCFNCNPDSYARPPCPSEAEVPAAPYGKAKGIL